MSTEVELEDLKFPGQPKLPKRFLLLSLLTLILVGLIPLSHYLFDDIDRQYANLLSILFGVLAFVLFLVTVWRFPFVSLQAKQIVTFGSLGILVLGSVLFEFRGFNGEMQPVFRSRFSVRQFTSDKERLRNLSPSDIDALQRLRFTQFLGSRRNGVIDDPLFSMEWEKRLPEILWHRPIGSGWSGFSVAEGLAVTMEQLDEEESITAIRLISGEIAWQHKSPGKHFHALGGMGPRSTPTLVETPKGWLVVALGATGRLTCLRLADGSEVWSVSLLDDAGITQAQSELEVSWGRSASPLVFDDKVVVPLGGKYLQAETKRSLIAYSLHDGDELWRTGISQIAYTSPTLMRLDDVEQIVSVNEGNVTGHDPKTGEQLWESLWPSKSNADACASQPVQVDGQRLLIGKGYAQGSKLIEIKQVSEETRNKSVRTWKASDLWVNTKVLKTKFTSAVCQGDNLYALSDGVLECVSAGSGKRLWRGERFGQGQLLLVNGVLLVTAEDGRIAAVNPENGITLAQHAVLDGVTWNTAAVAGPYLLVRNATEAVCLKSSLE
ncbi:MAG: PQQ-binding-like beta-propeller repeat protein [Planctomycetota bacterium]